MSLLFDVSLFKQAAGADAIMPSTVRRHSVSSRPADKRNNFNPSLPAAWQWLVCPSEQVL